MLPNVCIDLPDYRASHLRTQSSLLLQRVNSEYLYVFLALSGRKFSLILGGRYFQLSGALVN
jgi:hypothetical protein